MEDFPSDKHFDITESSTVSEETTEVSTAVEQPDAKPELSRTKRTLRALGEAALITGSYGGLTAATYFAMRSGSLDSLHIPAIQDGNSTDQLEAALEFTGVVGTTVVPAAKYVYKKLKK